MGAYGLNKLPRCGKCREALAESRDKQFLRGLVRYRHLIGLGLLGGSLVLWLALNDQTVGNQGSPRNEGVTLCPTYRDGYRDD